MEKPDTSSAATPQPPAPLPASTASTTTLFPVVMGVWRWLTYPKRGVNG